MLTHDIRGALTGVIGGIALLDRSTMTTETRVQFDRVAAAAQALASLVSDAEGDALAETPVEVNGLMRFLVRRWTGEAQEKQLTFSVTLGEGLPAFLRVDFLTLSRVLGNLIGNAIKFSDAGLVHLTVRRGADGGIVFCIRDEGSGLGDAETVQLFSFGYRTGSGAKPGQGIGLHIAKTLTEQMDGTITLANRPEGGVEAVFSLPASRCEGLRSGSSEDNEDPPDLRGLRVLLAEDNPTNQMVASQMLRTMHAEVVVASDGVEALALFEAHDVDLLMVDIEMPRKSGLDVIREVRARSDRRGRIPIVALTAYAMKEHRNRITEAGADGLISKPIVSIGAFGRAVAGLVQQRSRSLPAVTAQEAATDPVFNMDTYHALAQAIGPEMMAELLDRVIADLQAAEASLRIALDPLDLVAVRATSHIVISVAGAVGAERLQNRARQLNSDANSDGGGTVGPQVGTCLRELASALAFIRKQRARC
jgi:two-component system, OmpR family, aerobic respiration control sensor histidine kinase ArcB